MRPSPAGTDRPVSDPGSDPGSDPVSESVGRRADRLGRTLAVLLALVSASLASAAYMIQRGTDQHREALLTPVPPALTTAYVPARPATSPPHTRPAHRTQPARPSTAAHRPPPVPRPLIAPMAPTHLFIPSIGVNTAIHGKPTELARDPFLGRTVPSFGVPDDMYTTTWWSSGPKPGSAGMAVVLGHTQINGYGVFNKLGSLKQGAVIGLTRGDRVLKFAVIAVRTGISKRRPNALRNTLAAHPRQARLALLTCSGNFNGSYRASAENTVVFARLVSAG